MQVARASLKNPTPGHQHPTPNTPSPTKTHLPLQVTAMSTQNIPSAVITSNRGSTPPTSLSAATTCRWKALAPLPRRMEDCHCRLASMRRWGASCTGARMTPLYASCTIMSACASCMSARLWRARGLTRESAAYRALWVGGEGGVEGGGGC